MEGDVIGSEDCLYLNIYTPPLEVISKKGPLPIIFWIHGGGWQGGSASSFSNPDYLLDKDRDIIFVSINYRLGALGLLSTETLDSPGNFGLKTRLWP